MLPILKESIAAQYVTTKPLHIICFNSPIPFLVMTQPKSRTIACILALTGVLLPGLHKFYLGQARWGLAYFLLGLLWTAPLAMMTRVASICDGLIYLAQGEEQFNLTFNPEWQVAPSPKTDPETVGALAQALRQLDGLRQEGLITDYEFEQQRRQLLG